MLSRLVSVRELQQAFLAVDVETLEYFGVGVGVKTNGTPKLLFHFL
jgi:hypothetical protein